MSIKANGKSINNLALVKTIKFADAHKLLDGTWQKQGLYLDQTDSNHRTVTGFTQGFLYSNGYSDTAEPNNNGSYNIGMELPVQVVVPLLAGGKKNGTNKCFQHDYTKNGYIFDWIDTQALLNDKTTFDDTSKIMAGAKSDNTSFSSQICQCGVPLVNMVGTAWSANQFFKKRYDLGDMSNLGISYKSCTFDSKCKQYFLTFEKTNATDQYEVTIEFLTSIAAIYRAYRHSGTDFYLTGYGGFGLMVLSDDSTSDISSLNYTNDDITTVRTTSTYNYGNMTKNFGKDHASEYLQDINFYLGDDLKISKDNLWIYVSPSPSTSDTPKKWYKWDEFCTKKYTPDGKRTIDDYLTYDIAGGFENYFTDAAKSYLKDGYSENIIVKGSITYKTSDFPDAMNRKYIKIYNWLHNTIDYPTDDYLIPRFTTIVTFEKL